MVIYPNPLKDAAWNLACVIGPSRIESDTVPQVLSSVLGDTEMFSIVYLLGSQLGFNRIARQNRTAVWPDNCALSEADIRVRCLSS